MSEPDSPGAAVPLGASILTGTAAAGDTAAATNVRQIGFKRPKKTGMAEFMTRPEAGALLAAVVAFVFFSLFADKFLSIGIIGNIFLLSAELGIVAIGAALLMIAGEFDLSVGSVIGLSSGIAIMLLNFGVPGILQLLITLLIAAAMGWLNGMLVTGLQSKLLILDEPTAALSLKETGKVLRYIAVPVLSRE